MSSRPPTAGTTASSLHRAKASKPYNDRAGPIYSDRPEVPKDPTAFALDMPSKDEPYIPKMQVERNKALPPQMARAVTSLVPEGRQMGSSQKSKPKKARKQAGSDSESDDVAKVKKDMVGMTGGAAGAACRALVPQRHRREAACTKLIPTV